MAMDRLENLKNIIMYLMADNRVSHRIPSTLEERQRMMRALMNVWSSESIQACLEGRVATNEDEVNVWEPRPISEDFLKMQDAELQMQCEDKGVVEISDITPQTSDILLWQGDITRLKVEAIVNAANAQALGCWAPLHNCIDNCIHSAAGIQLRKECADKMQGRLLATGDAFITQGYNLPARYVIHSWQLAIAAVLTLQRKMDWRASPSAASPRAYSTSPTSEQQKLPLRLSSHTPDIHLKRLYSMFSSTKTVTSTSSFSERKEWLSEQIAEADYVLIGAGAGLTTAAGIDYAGEDFRREFREWIDRYGIADLYSSSFFPFETEEERWAMWAKHIWFSRYRTGALPLYKKLLKMVDGKDYFVITTNVDGQFEMAGFDTHRIFATQGDYCYFQPASGAPKELYHNREWVERALPAIKDCRIPTELIPHTPDGQPVSMNLRCDDTFVEDAHWHEQAQRYSDFVSMAHDKRMLLLEFGVGFNTPVIIHSFASTVIIPS